MNREDFPILSQLIYNRPLVYLDNAATTQKPQCVIDAISEMYSCVNANVHRGVHYLSQKATDRHEAAREVVRQFINARSTAEIIFTRGTTESINLVASSFGEAFLREGDEVIVSTMEHHSNIVPWQLLRDRKGIVIKVIPITDEGCLDMEAYENLFTERTKLVSVAHVSNVLGTVNPVKELARIAVERGCGRLELSCLDWNKPSIDFYLSLGAIPMDEWTTYRLTGERLRAFAENESV
jgi:cysteine desulfurase/selenocysteine lyase